VVERIFKDEETRIIQERAAKSATIRGIQAKEGV